MASNYHMKERCFKGSPEEYIRLRAKKHRKQYQDQAQARVLENLAEEVERLRAENNYLRTENERLKVLIVGYKKWATTMEETVDNVRAALELESTHYLVLPSQVADVVEQNKQLRTVLKDVIEFSNNEAKSKRAEWAIKKARQALNAEGVGKCTCADHQGGPCASCMETKYNL